MRLVFRVLCVAVIAAAIAAPAFAQSICSPVVLTSVQVKEETEEFSIDVEYPVLCNAVVTRTLRDHVLGELSAFKEQRPMVDGIPYHYKHEMIVDYSVWTAGKGRYASVKMQTMIFTGGAHPNHWPETWVFDLINGRRLSLGDVFVDPQLALEKIAPMVRKVLVLSLGQMAVPSMLDPGIEPTEKNYADFILNSEGIAFFFAPYQVAPYAAGQQAVTIPYEEIADQLTSGMKGVLLP